MVALRAWYDPDADDEPIIVSTPADADACVDRMRADRPTMRIPPMMQLSRRDADGWAVLHVGVDTDRGILTHTDAAGSFVTTNGADRTGEPLRYDYMGHLREVPANAELPLSDIRKAVRDFVATNGARSESVAWQADE